VLHNVEVIQTGCIVDALQALLCDLRASELNGCRFLFRSELRLSTLLTFDALVDALVTSPGPGLLAQLHVELIKASGDVTCGTDGHAALHHWLPALPAHCRPRLACVQQSTRCMLCAGYAWPVGGHGEHVASFPGPPCAAGVAACEQRSCGTPALCTLQTRGGQRVRGAAGYPTVRGAGSTCDGAV
jgi:hypothetical protein